VAAWKGSQCKKKEEKEKENNRKKEGNGAKELIFESKGLKISG
jgi:hypothetical protein